MMIVKPPGGAKTHLAERYGINSVRTHCGRTFTSLHGFNSGEPAGTPLSCKRCRHYDQNFR